MTKLVEAYVKYYRAPTRDHADELFNEIKAYDFADYQGDMDKIGALDPPGLAPKSLLSLATDNLRSEAHTLTSALTSHSQLNNMVEAMAFPVSNKMWSMAAGVHALNTRKMWAAADGMNVAASSSDFRPLWLTEGADAQQRLTPNWNADKVTSPPVSADTQRNIQSLSTNGSTTGWPTRYAFSPFFEFWRTSIEHVLRFPDKENVDFSLANRTPSLWHDKQQDRILRLFEKKGPVALTGFPVNFMYLTTSRSLASWIRDCGAVQSIVSYNWEPFYRKRDLKDTIHINDQMIDWRSGLNFYTCTAYRKHILPTFYRKGGFIRNTVNLLGTSLPEADLFKINNFERCPCGRVACNFEFIPHLSNTIQGEYGEIFYDPDFIEQLEGEYLNLQFFQDQSTQAVTIYVCSVIKTLSADLDCIASKMKELGLDYHFQMDRGVIIGAKMFNFWRGKPENNKEFILSSTKIF